MIQKEYLEIGGLALEWPPSGDTFKVEPLFASTEITLLGGQTVLQRSPQGGTRLTITGADTFVVPQAVRDLVQGAWANGTPLHLAETLSNPAKRTVWPACIVTACEFREMPGTGREYYNFPSITFLAGV